MQLEIPTPEPVMVRRQEPLTIQLVDHLPNYCLQYIQKHANADDFIGITANQSEGFNWLIKDLNNWKEEPIDCILLSFPFSTTILPIRN